MSNYDLAQLLSTTKALCDKSGLSFDVLTRSILGKEIPVFRLGQGKKTVVYVAGHSGTDSLLSAVLLDFLCDYLTQYEKKGKVFDTSLSYLFTERSILLVPLLNPDGVDYVLEGVFEDNPLCARVRHMNGGDDFSTWRANARGVDLTHNYSTGFFAHKEWERRQGIISGAYEAYSGEYPESEPETAALCRLLRFLGEDILGVLDLQLGDGKLYCSCKDKLSAKTMAAGRILGRALALRDPTPQMVAPTGGLADWCIEKLSRPAYRLTCDISRYSQQKARTLLFEHLRRALYTFPFML